MAWDRWAVSHVKFTCDKCGDTQQDTQGGPMTIDWDGSLKVVNSNPLGEEKVYDLCRGCAGMLKHFLGVGIP